MENKFDKEIEDLGWEKMQALLDKEKPVVGIIPPQYIDQKSGKNASRTAARPFQSLPEMSS